MIAQEKVTKDIWAMMLSGTGEIKQWKLNNATLDNGLSFHVCGRKYVGIVKITSEIEKGTNLIIFEIKFIGEGSSNEEILLAKVTSSDISRITQDKGASIPHEAIERFELDFGL